MGRGGVSVLVGLTLVLSGCSGSTSDQPKVLPPVVTPSASPSVAPTVSAGPVVVPSAAAAATPQGAAAFVRFFIDEVSASFAHADSSRVKRLSEASCDTCRSYEKAADELHRDGQRVLPASLRVLSAEAPPAENGYVFVDLIAEQPKRELVDSANRVVESLASIPRVHLTVVLHRVSQSWLVRGVQAAK